MEKKVLMIYAKSIGGIHFEIWTGFQPSHGPQNWKWRFPLSWLWIDMKKVNNMPTDRVVFCYRLWIYMPWGALYTDISKSLPLEN